MAFEIPINFKPILSKADARRFSRQVEREAGSAGVGRGRGGGLRANAGTAALGGGIGGKGLAGSLGIGAGIALAVQILNQFKGVTKMISVISKVLIEFLRPIADVIILLLRPILSILKPILLVVRQVMAPFRKIALQLSAAGAKAAQSGDAAGAAQLFGASIAAGLAGLNAVITALLSKTINIVILSLAEILAVSIGSFIPGAGDKIREGAQRITEFINAATAVQIETNARMIQEMAKRFGVDMEGKFLADTQKVIDEVILGGKENSLVNSFRKSLDVMATEIPKDVDNAFSPIINSIQANLNKIKNLTSQAERAGGRSFGSIVGSVFGQAARTGLALFTPSAP